MHALKMAPARSSSSSFLNMLKLAALAVALGSIPPMVHAAAPVPPCSKPCFIVSNYWPIKTCRAECNPDICTRGWGAYESEAICCSPGVAFREGCGKRPTECWVVESYQMRTCIRDDRKCLQGYNVWESQAACCGKGAAFPQGCRTDIKKPAQPCWVVDTYFPARLCRPAETLCSPEAGVQSWPDREACCQPGAAFSEGCSANGPQAPCWIVDTYWPARTCRQEHDIAECSRGWGVYESKAVCCAPNVGFPEGCSADGAAGASTTTTTTGKLADGTGAKVQPALGSAPPGQRSSIRVVKVPPTNQPKVAENSGP